MPQICPGEDCDRRPVPGAPKDVASAHLLPVDHAGLAPVWHTAALVAVMLGVAMTGLLSGAHGPAFAHGGSRVRTTYLPMLAVQWGMAFYVLRVGRGPGPRSSLLGRRWSNGRRATLDVAFAAALFLSIEMVESWCTRGGAARSVAVLALLPRTPIERFAWIAVAVSAGVCEELVYRGYLQRQLGAFTGRMTLGVVLQALLFGLAHGEQGLAVMLRAAIHGIVLGSFAEWRRSLVPGMLAHVGVDLASGLLG